MIAGSFNSSAKGCEIRSGPFPRKKEGWRHPFIQQRASANRSNVEASAIFEMAVQVLPNCTIHYITLRTHVITHVLFFGPWESPHSALAQGRTLHFLPSDLETMVHIGREREREREREKHCVSEIQMENWRRFIDAKNAIEYITTPPRPSFGYTSSRIFPRAFLSAALSPYIYYTRLSNTVATSVSK